MLEFYVISARLFLREELALVLIISPENATEKRRFFLRREWRRNMEYTIPELNTINSLNLAKELHEFDVQEQFTFDTSKMKWVRPFGMLIAVSSIKQFRNCFESIPFNMLCNISTNGVTYAGHMGFFRAISDKIDVGKMPGEATGNDNYIPITEIDLQQLQKNEVVAGNYIAMGNTIEIESKRLAHILSRNNKELHILLTYLIREMLRNIPEHSDSNTAWICGQYWSDDTAEIAILDNGIGVKGSLRKNAKHREYIETDADALRWAIKAGISQAFQPSKTNVSDDVWSNSGFGLYMVSQICKELNGSFCLASGNKYIFISSDGTINIEDTYISGTAVKMTISTNKISKAQSIIDKIASQGEQEAKAIRNTFKKASKPSKGLIENL
jgi:hypothetical protein